MSPSFQLKKNDIKVWEIFLHLIIAYSITKFNVFF